jgi:hypothetical protein
MAVLSAVDAQAQTFRTDDPVIERMWEEGMERSQTYPLAQALIDSIGPRLSGAPGFDQSADWLIQLYEEWGIEVERDEYGTWRGWSHGVLHVDMTSPRVQTLEANILAWSPGTDGPVEADVVMVPEFSSAAEVEAWLPSVEGKMVLASHAEPTCREPQTLERRARPETVERIQQEREALQGSWFNRLRMLGDNPHRRLEQAGAVGIITSRWSEGWGVNKVFAASTEEAVAIDVSCEDYGLLYRIAEHEQGPRLRINAETEELGTVPVYNVMATIPGTELPDEYVLLSAHLDSWHAATGATDKRHGHHHHARGHADPEGDLSQSPPHHHRGALGGGGAGADRIPGLRRGQPRRGRRAPGRVQPGQWDVAGVHLPERDPARLESDGDRGGKGEITQVEDVDLARLGPDAFDADEGVTGVGREGDPVDDTCRGGREGSSLARGKFDELHPVTLLQGHHEEAVVGGDVDIVGSTTGVEATEHLPCGDVDLEDLVGAVARHIDPLSRMVGLNPRGRARGPIVSRPCYCGVGVGVPAMVRVPASRGHMEPEVVPGQWPLLAGTEVQPT